MQILGEKDHEFASWEGKGAGSTELEVMSFRENSSKNQILL
jgi:hypothetical protein